MAREAETKVAGRSSPVLFIRVVGGLFLAMGAMGLLASAGQLAVLFQPLPGRALDGAALTLPLVLALASTLVVVVSLSFLRRLRWARSALGALAALGILVSLVHLLVPADVVEPLPPEAPVEYARLLQLISVLNVAVPIVGCVVLGFILWRLQAPPVRDQFR